MRMIVALAALGALAASQAGSAPSAADAALPASAFVAPAKISDARLSPDGGKLAFIRRDGDVEDVVVMDLAGQAKPTGVHFQQHTGVNWVRWKSDRRLLIGITYFEATRRDPRNPKSEITSWKYGKFMLSSDLDGSNQTILFKSDRSTAQKTGSVMQLLDALKKDPDHVLALAPLEDGRPAVWRADIHSGAAQVIETGDSDTLGWDTDSKGTVVARYELRGRTLAIQGRAPGETRWTDIVRLRTKELRKELADFELLGAGEAPGTSYVAVKPKDGEAGDVRTVHLYDFRTHTLGPDLWPGLGYDVASIVQSSETSAMLGVCYTVDLLQCDFKDHTVQANMRGLSRYFQNRKSLTPLSWSDDGHWWLFETSGPDDPGSYYLYDWTRHQVTPLGPRYPELPPEKLGTRRPYAFVARDGVRIPGYLTLPLGASKGPLPMVVLPHGGPMVRDDLDYDLWAQFVANQGYLVFQPNFRGSGGYGRRWLEAGFGQWGGRMQDDIVDGVKALVTEGLADPSRICVFGASYGGYAALIQGARHPDLYKCVVSWAGVSDLPRLLKAERESAGADSELYLYDRKSIGDPERERERLAQESAITYAATYGPPVLLVHGSADTNVPADQSREFERALRKAHRDVRLVLVDGEDHTDWDDDNMSKALDQVAAFLRAHIAPATAAPTATATSTTAAAANPRPAVPSAP